MVAWAGRRAYRASGPIHSPLHPHACPGFPPSAWPWVCPIGPQLGCGDPVAPSWTLQLRTVPYPCSLYLPVGRLHLGLKLLQEYPPPGGCWAASGPTGPCSALRGLGVSCGEAVTCRALGKGHGDEGLAPPAGWGTRPRSGLPGPVGGLLSGQLWVWSSEVPALPCSSLRGLVGPQTPQVSVPS